VLKGAPVASADSILVSSAAVQQAAQADVILLAADCACSKYRTVSAQNEKIRELGKEVLPKNPPPGRAAPPTGCRTDQNAVSRCNGRSFQHAARLQRIPQGSQLLGRDVARDQDILSC